MVLCSKRRISLSLVRFNSMLMYSFYVLHIYTCASVFEKCLIRFRISKSDLRFVYLFHENGGDNHQ